MSLKPWPGQQRGSATGEHDVLGKRRTVLGADAKVFSDCVVNGRLEQNEFERLGAFETERKLKFAKPLTLGVMSKSAPALAKKIPG